MMSAHLSKEQIDNYRKRLMEPKELLSADDHISTCEDCRHQLSNERSVQKAASYLHSNLRMAEGESNHLLYEQMESYVDNRLDEVDREIIDSHLEFCTNCKLEIEDLLALKGTIKESPVRVTATAEQTPFWERVLNFWRLSFNWAPLQVGGLAAVAALLIFSVVMVRQVSNLRTEVGELQKTNSELQKEAAEAVRLREEVAQLRETLPGQKETAQTVAALYDGDRLVTLDEKGIVAGFDSLSANYQEEIAKALKTGRIETAQLKDLNGKTDNLMGSSSEEYPFILSSPANRVIQSDRPTFVWASLGGAASYSVGIYDGSFKEVASSGSLAKTEWTIDRTLERGRIYYWQVTAIRDGKEIRSPRPPAPLMKFKVLDSKDAEELAKAKKSYKDSHLLLGMLYARIGLFDDAQREFKALVEENPKSPIAQKLLRSVQRS